VHELGLAKGIVRQALVAARGEPVQVLRVRIGPDIPDPEVLLMALLAASQNTPIKGATLVVRQEIKQIGVVLEEIVVRGEA
jgi:hypothetical protein